MSGDFTSATIGMQNATGSSGLQMSFNSNYAHDNLTTYISKAPSWTGINEVGNFELTGELNEGASSIINIIAQNDQLPEGIYNAYLNISSNASQSESFLIELISSTTSLAGDLNDDGEIDSLDYLLHAETNKLNIYKPLGLFEITPIGLLIMGVGIVYLMLVGRKLLPDYPDESLTEDFNIREYVSEIVVMSGSRLIGELVFKSSLAQMDFQIIKILRKKNSFVPNARSKFEEDDVLLVSGRIDDLMAVKDASGIEIKAEVKLEDDSLHTEETKIAELLITPKSTLIRNSLKEANFRQRFGLAVLAIYRHGQVLGRKLGVIKLRAGDLLLVQGSEDRLQSLENDTNLVRLEVNEAPSGDRRRKGFMALGFFGFAVLAGGAIIFLGNYYNIRMEHLKNQKL